MAGLGFALIASVPAWAADHVIMLGATISLTGKYATIGTNAKNGYDLAVREINDTGGIKIAGQTYEILVRYYDDQSTPARCAKLTERLIKQDGASFLLGPCSSVLTETVLPIAEQHKVPMVQASGAASDLFTKGYRYLFSVLSTSDRYLTAMVDLMVENAQKLRQVPGRLTLAMASEDDPFGRDVRAGVLAEAQRQGIDIVIDDQLPPSLDDMSMTLNKIKTLKPHALMVAGHEKAARTAVNQIEALHVDVPIIAMTNCDAARLAETKPKPSQHVFCAQQWNASLPYEGELFGTAANFAQRFQEAYGYAPPYQAAQSAVAVYVFADAFRRAQSLDPETVRGALAKTDLATFYGPIKFDASGKNVAKPMFLSQIVDGAYIVVSPHEWAKDEPVIPRPPH